jgi:hypothetical protein
MENWIPAKSRRPWGVKCLKILFQLVNVNGMTPAALINSVRIFIQIMKRKFRNVIVKLVISSHLCQIVGI